MAWILCEICNQNTTEMKLMQRYFFLVHWKRRGKLSGRQMGAQRNVVKLCWVQEKQHKSHSQVSHLGGKNLCKTANTKQAELAEKLKRLLVASHTVVCTFAWKRKDLSPGYYFHVPCCVLWLQLIGVYSRSFIKTINKTWQKPTLDVNHDHLKSSNPENSYRMRLLFLLTFEFRKKRHSDVSGFCSIAFVL